MQGILYEEASLGQFLLVTIVLGGFAAWMAGKGAAESWRTLGNIISYTFLIGVAVRFIHHALFDGTMFSLHYYLVDTAFLMVFSVLGFLYTRTKQMTESYYWIYEKAGPFSWRKKSV